MRSADRANIFILNDATQGNGTLPHTGIYLYTHYNGADWPEMLRLALSYGRIVWSDPAYLTRVITSHVFEDLRYQEGGGGISPYLTDNEWPITVVDMKSQTVSWAEAGAEGYPPARVDPHTFMQYVNLDEAEYPDAHQVFLASLEYIPHNETP